VLLRLGRCVVLAAVLGVAMGIAGVVEASEALASVRLSYTTATRVADFVWVANARGGARRRLGPGQSPSLARDGRAVAAVLGHSPGGVVIYPAGGGPRQRYLSGGVIPQSVRMVARLTVCRGVGFTGPV